MLKIFNYLIFIITFQLLDSIVVIDKLEYKVNGKLLKVSINYKNTEKGEILLNASYEVLQVFIKEIVSMENFRKNN